MAHLMLHFFGIMPEETARMLEEEPEYLAFFIASMEYELECPCRADRQILKGLSGTGKSHR
jgi:hypothetical protein